MLGSSRTSRRMLETDLHAYFESDYYEDYNNYNNM
jgi:hypothetical protein